MGPLLTERKKDKLATVLIRAGGLLVILVVVGIVINIGAEALPLFSRASSGTVESVASGGGPLLAGSDPRRDFVWVLGRDAVVRFPGSPEMPPIEIFDDGPATLVAGDHEIHGLVSVVADSGRVAVGKLRFRDDWQGDHRSTSARWRASAEPLELGPAEWSGITANGDENGNLVVAAWDTDGGLVVWAWDADDEGWERKDLPAGRLTVQNAAVAEGLANLAVSESDGGIRVYTLPALSPSEIVTIGEPVSVLRFLVGGGTLVTGGRGGSVDVYLEVPRLSVENTGSRTLRVAGWRIAPGEAMVLPDDEIGRKLASRDDVVFSAAPTRWTAVRRLDTVPSRPQVIAPASRRRGFAIGTREGTVALYHSTSGRQLLLESWTEDGIEALAIDPKSDGLVALAGSEVLRRSVENPHPEISFRTLFLPVWYEGYAAPKWVWQSTGGSDAFEPKLSVWPLIFGTLKATLYAMLFSLPLALMAAVYVSQLAPTWLQSLVKPTLELMAAVPSVVVGFLAALWLAPRLESALMAVLLGAVGLPLAVVIALAGWRLVPGDLRRRLPDGAELLVLLATGTSMVALLAILADPIENRFFAGDLQRFLFTEWGMRYDQRNSIIVGLGLGFAVIPVIFTIAEDACSAVPRALVNASRALGATRWQTAIKLVVPAASPGLFAAVMLGLGRAVGETMIVLMAAGNTPLLDLSIFNGMRAMSAAIAVEIPEAPVGGTLFRVLFLTGTLLFAFTFVLTTAADFVGSYLRKRYARF